MTTLMLSIVLLLDTETAWSARIAAGDVLPGVGGQAEYKLPDGSRVDVLGESIAWEVEWSDKWPEAIGQAVFYGLAADRRPGVILLLRGKHDEDYLRCLLACRHLEIELRTVEIDARGN